MCLTFSGRFRHIWTKMMKASQINIKKLIAPILAGVILTGCADGNIHQFLNSDFLNSTAPNVATLGKMFYPDRYEFYPKETTPAAFANFAPDHIGKWDFYGFSGIAKENLYMANYYDPSSIKRSGSSVSVNTFFYLSNPKYTKLKKPYLSLVVKNAIDCDLKIIKYEFATAYATTRISDGVVSKTDLSKTMKPFPVEDDSLEARLYKKVCT